MVATNMKQLEYECYNTVTHWLDVHFHYTILILFLLTILILILHLYQLIICSYIENDFISAWRYRYHEQFNEGSLDARIHRWLMFILLELVLMFIYVSAALILRWTFNTGPITPMTFNRLIIEACYGPIIYEIFLYFWFRYLILRPDEIPGVAFHAQFACMIRLLLFLVTRYAEFHPSSRLNNVQARMFGSRCNFSIPYNYDLIPM